MIRRQQRLSWSGWWVIFQFPYYFLSYPSITPTLPFSFITPSYPFMPPNLSQYPCLTPLSSLPYPNLNLSLTPMLTFYTPILLSHTPILPQPYTSLTPTLHLPYPCRTPPLPLSNPPFTAILPLAYGDRQVLTLAPFLIFLIPCPSSPMSSFSVVLLVLPLN